MNTIETISAAKLNFHVTIQETAKGRGVFTRKAEVRGQKALMLGVSIKTYFVG